MTQTDTKKKTKNATTSNTTGRTSTSRAHVAAHQRDPRVIAVDTAYAVAGLGSDTVQVARKLPERARALREVEVRRPDIEARVRSLRDRLEERFDAKASEGRTVIDDLLAQEQVKTVLGQAKTARSQVKAAVTSLRKTATQTVTAGLDAGREQAGTARRQVKAARTSVQKTAGAAVEATRGLLNGGGQADAS